MTINDGLLLRYRVINSVTRAQITVIHLRDGGRSENMGGRGLGGARRMWCAYLICPSPWVEIGLPDLEKSAKSNGTERTHVPNVPPSLHLQN